MSLKCSPTIFAALLLFASASAPTVAAAADLERIVLSEDGRHFALAESGAAFRPWGVNYDHNEKHDGALLEDYWVEDWALIVEDFGEIVALGANTVRIHLQVGRFMDSPTQANAAALERLAMLLELAAENGLRLDLTGLGCYHKQDLPAWFRELGEKDRWAVQARFWEAIAGTCQGHPAVFCYDLMNEPILPGKKIETEWLAGELGGKFFVQRLALDPAGRSREEIARAWVDTMVAAIRKHDPDTLVTVGVIPWALSFPKANPFFYSAEVGEKLDFVSVHFYPRQGEVDEALAALRKYDIGKPLVVEETFPLKCSSDELVQFMREAGPAVDGWISFYWGKSAAEYHADPEPSLANALKGKWIERFRELSPGPWPANP